MKWIFLDLDHTLYDYTPCNTVASEHIRKRLSEKFGAGELFDEGRKHTKALLPSAAATHSRLLYIARAIEMRGRPDPALAVALHNEFWHEYFKHMRLHEGVIEFLQAAREKYRIGIITNFTTEIQYRKIVHLGIAEYIDLIITSEEVGCEKPDPRIYAAACARAGCSPGDAIMIGDDEEHDVAGAQRFGMKAIHFKPGMWQRWQAWSP